MCLKTLKSKIFSKCRVKFKEGGPVPGVKMFPVWWDNPIVQQILKGKAVRLNGKKSGDKYLRNIILKHGTTGYKGITYGKVDVYAVLEAFGVVCPAAAHAVKKLLCPGIRGGKDAKQDIREAKDAVVRAFEMEEARIDLAEAMENAGDEPDPHDSF
jgi:hypothetical protein